MKAKLEETTLDQEKVSLVDVYTQLHQIAKQFEKELQEAPYINNGPEKGTVVTVEMQETQDTALMLNSFFSKHKHLIPACMSLKIDIDPSLLADAYREEKQFPSNVVNLDFDGCLYTNQYK